MTLNVFDKLLLLSQGKTCYYGPVQNLKQYFEDTGFRMPLQINPAEFTLDLTNSDFWRDREAGQLQLEKIHNNWDVSSDATSLKDAVLHVEEVNETCNSVVLVDESQLTNKWLVPITLLHRSFIKSYRDVVVYGIRIAMYMGNFYLASSRAGLNVAGLAIMMGTVWLRLRTDQEDIQPFINAIVSINPMSNRELH